MMLLTLTGTPFTVSVGGAGRGIEAGSRPRVMVE